MSLAAVLGFGAAYSFLLLFVPTSLVELAFGPTFGDARDLLAPCAAVMTLCGVVNIELILSFATRDYTFVRLTALGVIVQAVLLTFLHGSGFGILTATGAGAMFAIVAHEVRSPLALRRLASGAVSLQHVER
jgi:hypothetical protein